MKRRIVPTVRAVLMLAAAIFASAASARAQDAPALFKARCSVCHGSDGSGNSSMGKTLGARTYIQTRCKNSLMSN